MEDREKASWLDDELPTWLYVVAVVVMFAAVCWLGPRLPGVGFAETQIERERDAARSRR